MRRIRFASTCRISILLAFAGALAGCQSVAPRSADPEAAAAAKFAAVRRSPTLLRTFLQALPKGGDIHTHLTGAVYAERYVDWAVADGLCIDKAAMAIAAPPCDGTTPAAEAFKDVWFRHAMIDALSTRNLDRGDRSGHAQFFRSFAKYSAIPAERDGDMLADVARRAAEQNVAYLEVMKTFVSRPVRNLGKQIGWEADLDRFREKLLAGGFEALLGDAHRELIESEARMRQLLGCDGPTPEPGCRVEVRYLQQSSRTGAPEAVFAQLAFAFELAAREPKVVGLNLVAPEDDAIALRDYSLHMRMIQSLRRHRPTIRVALHAGELSLGLVPPEEMTFHIRQAVEIAGAERLGHAVSVAHEREAEQLMRELAARDIPVEILLTSNDVILGIDGSAHPFEEYLHFGVPLMLATDDEGVSRSDLTNEFQRAVSTYPFLDYRDLKRFVRHSVSYSFLPGPSLWSDRRRGLATAACADQALGAATPGGDCAAFLAGSEKARMEWRVEGELKAFEARVGQP